MSKKLFFYCTIICVIMSCSDESEQLTAEKTQVSLSATENFRFAINEMSQPKYFPTK